MMLARLPSITEQVSDWPLFGTSVLRRAALLASLCCCQAIVGRSNVQAQDPATERLRRIDIDERLGKKLPLDVEFRDHTGKRVRLGDYFDGRRPVVLTFAYYTCPVLCSLVFDAAAAAMRELSSTMGKEFVVLTISIDPRDTSSAAAQKRQQVLKGYGRAVQQPGWSFLVGSVASQRAVAKAAGFKYFYDEQQREYGHAAALMVLTPSGEMARYFYGLRFPPGDLRLALLEASQGRFATVLEKVMLYCYRYDSSRSGYVLMATRVMQIGGALVAMILGFALALFWRHEYAVGVQHGQ